MVFDKRRRKMRKTLIAMMLFVAIIFISTSVTANLLYPYPIIEPDGSNSVSPYLCNTSLGRGFWFEQSPDAKNWAIDWDKERRPFRTIVIHHSAGKINETPLEMEAIAKEKYIARYNSYDNDPYVKGLEPHSFHIVLNQETFLPYHYLIYEDGKIIRWLKPLINIDGTWYIDNVAWHAGNWGVNCESLSVCLVGDYSHSSPTEEQLGALQGLVTELKLYNQDAKVVPHYDINTKTDCPGDKYSQWAIT